jgi:general bacterial porin, GBP family
MKKTLLAAALLAGFAGAASAQSSVTLYGIIDGGLRYNKVSHRQQ